MSPEPSSAEPSDLAARAAHNACRRRGRWHRGSRRCAGSARRSECASPCSRRRRRSGRLDPPGRPRRCHHRRRGRELRHQGWTRARPRGGARPGRPHRPPRSRAGHGWPESPVWARAPLPVGGILGIPANPFQPDVRRIIGWSGVWRAYPRPRAPAPHDRAPAQSRKARCVAHGGEGAGSTRRPRDDRRLLGVSRRCRLSTSQPQGSTPH